MGTRPDDRDRAVAGGSASLDRGDAVPDRHLQTAKGVW